MHTAVHTKKTVCMSLHREKVVSTDLIGFMPAFLCAN